MNKREIAGEIAKNNLQLIEYDYKQVESSDVLYDIIDSLKTLSNKLENEYLKETEE